MLKTSYVVWHITELLSFLTSVKECGYLFSSFWSFSSQFFHNTYTYLWVTSAEDLIYRLARHRTFLSLLTCAEDLCNLARRTTFHHYSEVLKNVTHLIVTEHCSTSLICDSVNASTAYSTYILGWQDSGQWSRWCYYNHTGFVWYGLNRCLLSCLCVVTRASLGSLGLPRGVSLLLLVVMPGGSVLCWMCYALHDIYIPWWSLRLS